jgi:hypothetical protein
MTAALPALKTMDALYTGNTNYLSEWRIFFDYNKTSLIFQTLAILKTMLYSGKYDTTRGYLY